MDKAKEGLLMALESADPAVRSLAIKRREIDEQINKLDGFFGAYAELASGSVPLPKAIVKSGIAAVVGNVPPRPVELTKTGKRKKGKMRVSSMQFDATVRELIIANGGPTPVTILLDAYCKRHGHESEVNFSRRLQRREKVHLVEGKGYWLNDVHHEMSPINGSGDVAH